MKPPVARRVEHAVQVHDEQWIDHYAWLRAENWQACLDDPDKLPEDIREYLAAENDWFEHSMSDTRELQKVLVAEMRGRIKDVDESLPDAIGQWCYLERYAEAAEHPETIRYLRAGGQEQLLIDLNHEARQSAYFDPGDVEYSPDHKHLVWTADTSGSERYKLFIRCIETSIDTQPIENVESVCWGNHEYLFYTRLDSEFRPSQVYRHRLGTAAEDDVLVYEEKDSRFFCSVWTSLSADYVFISADMNDQSEVWFIPVNDLTRAPAIIEPRRDGIEYSIDHQQDRFLILTNADDAHDFKIMQTPCEKPSREHWTDWLAYRDGVMVVDMHTYRDWVMWVERENALPRICFCSTHENLPEDQVHTLKFDQQAYAISLEPLLEYNENVFRYTFESPCDPCRTLSYNMHNGEEQLLKQESIPSGHEPSDYVVKRLHAPAAGNVSIPVTMLCHKDTALDGSAFCYITAYGAYGSSMPAEFSSDVLSLVNRGMIYVIAHVRGGQELGRAWYEMAMLDKKTNTFDDVLSVGEFLVAGRYTDRGKLVLSGASAGGLMVGAVLNRHSDLWAAAIADVPFVDVVNTLLDESLPLTPGEWTQWGNPRDDKNTFDRLRDYSPYDNISDNGYPPILVTAGVSDTRVTYWEPAKWVARMRATRTDDALLLLKTNMSSGHFGDTGRYAALSDLAIEYAFVLKVAS